MGEVFRARDTRLGRNVALKVLAAPFKLDADGRARFEREARAIALQIAAARGSRTSRASESSRAPAGSR
jgi:serine/threonine protein kinase